MSTITHCQTCADATGTQRYCAPKACYCGHPDCYAFASYVELRPLNVTSIKPRDDRMKSAWDDRGEGSWIDGL